jgi:hypothetical protein
MSAMLQRTAPVFLQESANSTATGNRSRSLDLALGVVGGYIVR